VDIAPAQRVKLIKDVFVEDGDRYASGNWFK
jgi:hypothetical protein